MYVCTCIFELCTDDNSVLFTPAIITDCAPLVVIIRTINQSHITLWAYTCTVEDKQKDVIYQLQQHYLTRAVTAHAKIYLSSLHIIISLTIGHIAS